MRKLLDRKLVSKLTERRILVLILVLFGLLGIIYAFITPIFEASDELWHYPMVKHLADGNSLPTQTFDPGRAGPWKQEASQPPLYYYLAAALTFWVDTSDMEQVRWLNPHVDVGVLTEDGNINLVVHDPDSNPWRGTILAVRLVRLFSVALGAVTVYLTYRIAREVVPDRPEIALGAAALNGFTPMFIFISGAVNNDNLVIPLASFSLLIMINIVVHKDRRSRSFFTQLFVLGLVIGLGSLTKITALGLLLLAAGTLYIEQWNNRGEPATLGALLSTAFQAAKNFLIVLAPVLIISGWWYYRNQILYGDWSGWNAFIAVLGQRATPASLAQLWDERWGFMMSYWGLFGGLNIAMPQVIYHILNGVFILATLGFVYMFVKMISTWILTKGRRISSLGALIWNLLKFIESHFALTLCFLWSAAVVIGLVRWATITWSSQGRLVFSAISALSTLLMLGLVGWLPRRLAQKVILGLGLSLLTISALVPFLLIRPSYQPHNTRRTSEFRIANKNFGHFMRLRDFDVDKYEVMPGEKIQLSLGWEVLSEVQEDWSVFVHLNDPVLNNPIVQRDMYPRQGLVPTSLMEEGDQFTDTYVLNIPEIAIAPSELELSVGMYNYLTEDRVALANGDTAVTLKMINLVPRPGTLPNPVSYNFEDEMELSGFLVDSLHVEAGEELRLKLYWRALKNLDVDYTIFAQVVDEETTRWASQDLPQSTSQWLVGDAQEVSMILPVSDATPPGVFPLIVGVYSRSEDGDFDRLQLLTNEGRLTDDFLTLARIRIDVQE